MSFSLHQINYIHADGTSLFDQLSFSVNKGDKVALIGENGCGKTTLLKLLTGSLQPTSGEIIRDSSFWFIPQHTGQFNTYTVAEALGIANKLHAFHSILKGEVNPDHFTILDDDWLIEDRANEGLSFWGLNHITLDTSMELLSGGEKTKVFLAGIHIHEPETILMDEPTNHLDYHSRELLYRFIMTTPHTLLIVSHDITLLNLLSQTMELSFKGIQLYGGNYDFYKIQKEAELEALREQLEDKEKSLRMARKAARETAERKSKLDSRGKKLSEKKGISRMGMNTLRDKAEKSTSRLKDVHEDKIEHLSKELKQLYNELPDTKSLKITFHSSTLHKGKKLLIAEKLNYKYTEEFLWKEDLQFEITSGERIVIKGKNGSGKTTLFKLFTEKLQPQSGILTIATNNYIYIDQEYSLLNNELTVIEQIEGFNSRHLPDHELKTLLARFLFPYESWNKKCKELSGGEKLKLTFCCLLTQNNTPDIILLDEPTNNLDIKSMEIIISVLKEYEGTLIVISHDTYFLKEIGIERSIEL